MIRKSVFYSQRNSPALSQASLFLKLSHACSPLTARTVPALSVMVLAKSYDLTHILLFLTERSLWARARLPHGRKRRAVFICKPLKLSRNIMALSSKSRLKIWAKARAMLCFTAREGKPLSSSIKMMGGAMKRLSRSKASSPIWSAATAIRTRLGCVMSSANICPLPAAKPAAANA